MRAEQTAPLTRGSITGFRWIARVCDHEPQTITSRLCHTQVRKTARRITPAEKCFTTASVTPSIL